MFPTLEQAIRRDRALAALCVAAISALAWIYLARMSSSMMTGSTSNVGVAAMGMVDSRSWGFADWIELFAMWTVMMVGMMLPSVSPVLFYMLQLYRRRGDQLARASAAAFVGGHLLAWIAFAALAATAQLSLHRAALISAGLTLESTVLTGSVLLAVGIYQCLPVKSFCLSHCRPPLQFLTMKRRDGTGGAFAMGLEHGGFCVGCCFALMALMFVVGVMNLFWAAGIAILVLVEKLAPRRLRIEYVSGLVLVVWGIARLASGTVAGQAAPVGLRFHHVHLNSVNPATAAEYYTKVFTTSVRTTFNGYEAVKTVNGPYLLFTKVNTPPPTQPQSAIWHFGWNTPDSRAYLERFHAMKLDVVPMYADPENTVIEISSDALPSFPTTARIRELRSQGVQPARVGGFQYLRGPDGSLVENAGNFPTEFFNHVHMFHEDPACAQLWYVTKLGIDVAGPGRGTPITAENCRRPYEEVTWPAFDKAGMVRNPAGAVPVSDMASILIRPRHGPFVSPRGQIVDHFALSVPDLDAAVARLKRDGVKVTEDIHRWGTMRAAMIEGPDLAAIELVEARP